MRGVEWNFQDINASASATKRMKLMGTRPEYVPRSVPESVKPDYLSSVYISPENEQEHDNINTYTTNRIGLRSGEFIETPDILAFGCSQTWGVGVPDESVWPKVLSEKLSMSYVNLGIPGASIMRLVLVVIDYIETYGAPTHVVGLLPDVRRMFGYVDTYINASGVDKRHSEQEEHHGEGLSDIHFPIPNERPTEKQVKSLTAKLSKRPHLIYEVNSYALPFLLSLQYLQFLQKYCRLQNINLILSSWDNDTVKLFKESELKNFYHLNFQSDFVKDQELYVNSCHPDMSDIYGENWYRGADHTKEHKGHMGIHRHLDYAEFFAEEITKNASR